MKAYQIQAGAGTSGLIRAERPSRTLGPADIRVRMEAASVNARDLAFARGTFPNPPATPIVPLVDGCGTVVEIGPEVTRFRIGDRVVTTYYPHWIDGAMTRTRTASSFGAQVDGTLAQEMAGSQEWFERAPASIDAAAAATLSCAGLTAWNALFCVAPPKPGATVLLLGTGGVSIWALQLASAAGLRTILTSSQDAKLERARGLGASDIVNYRTTPDWQDEVLRLTEEAGVDLVVEVGGEGTIGRSLQACGTGGTVVVVGRVAGSGGVLIEPGALIGGGKRLTGITAGSRAMLADLVRFVDASRISPVVDATFDFEDAREAYEHVATGSHFGKVAIAIND